MSAPPEDVLAAVTATIKGSGLPVMLDLSG